MLWLQWLSDILILNFNIMARFTIYFNLQANNNNWNFIIEIIKYFKVQKQTKMIE